MLCLACSTSLLLVASAKMDAVQTVAILAQGFCFELRAWCGGFRHSTLQ